MNGWEQDLHIYHLESAPIRETNLENYITKYLATKDNKYLELFLYYYEPRLNDKIRNIVQDYSMHGHFLDIKQTFVIGMINALDTYDQTKGIPFITYKEHSALKEVHTYIRTMRRGYTIHSDTEDLRLRKAMRLYAKYGYRTDDKTISKIAKAISTSPELTYEIICAGIKNQNFTDFYRTYSDEDSEESREEIASSPSTEPENIFFNNLRSEKLWTAFDALDYRERAMVSAHLGFCTECHSTYYYDNNDLDKNGKPKKKRYPRQTFQQLATDHALSSADSAFIIYYKAIKNLRKAINEDDSN